MSSWFALASAFGWIVVVVLASRLRGRVFATFVAILLGIHVAASTAMLSTFARVWPLYGALQAVVFIHFSVLSRPKMRSVWYRMLISVPASWFVAATFLSWPWAVLKAFGFHPWLPWLPYAVAVLGALDSLFAREEVVDIVLDGQSLAGLRRAPHGRVRAERPLRIVQITDPHLGPFMSVTRLRRIAERAVARQPDLILLTGDFLTMESQDSSRHLADALAPLRAYEGRAFACRGNHDLEAPEVVASALASAGVRLLVDESVRVETELGPIEVLGVDFRFRKRDEHMARVFAQNPRRQGELRITLLHDPGAFKLVPDGAADLVLSGHTHGGQLGLLWLGLRATIVSALTSLPDHGFWGRGSNRLYVHRGTGHYGFPLRIGVPAEHSVLNVHWLPR